MSVATKTLHRAVSHANPLTALTSARWALEGKSDFWALVIQLSTIAITVGVFVEVVATCIEIFEDRREGKSLPVHAILTLLGGAVVAAALAFEFTAEFKTASTETALRKNNAASQGELDKKAREATAQAVAIANKFGGLRKFVSQKEGEMDAAFLGFKIAAQQQQTREGKLITDLNSRQATLQTSLNSVDASAGKASSAADTASKTAASMTDTLSSERQMQAQMRAIITHRTMTAQQSAALIEALRQFSKTPFDLFVADDPDARELLLKLSQVLQDAQWDWKPSANIGLLSLTWPNKPQVGMVTVRGISIEIAESSKPQLERAVLALWNFLANLGWQVQGHAIPDKQMAAQYDKKIVHIFIGSRD